MSPGFCLDNNVITDIITQISPWRNLIQDHHNPDTIITVLYDKNIDTSLKLYYNIPIMLNINKYIKNVSGNGTLRHFKGIKLKNDIVNSVLFKYWGG